MPGWLDGLGDPSWQIRKAMSLLRVLRVSAGELGRCAENACSTIAERPLTQRGGHRSCRPAAQTCLHSTFRSRRRRSAPADGWLVSEMVRTLGRGRTLRAVFGVRRCRSTRHSTTHRDNRSTIGFAIGDDACTARQPLGRAFPAVGLVTGAVILVLTVGASIVVEQEASRGVIDGWSW